jgi:hypothetical protein
VQNIGVLRATGGRGRGPGWLARWLFQCWQCGRVRQGPGMAGFMQHGWLEVWETRVDSGQSRAARGIPRSALVAAATTRGAHSVEAGVHNRGPGREGVEWLLSAC